MRRSPVQGTGSPHRPRFCQARDIRSSNGEMWAGRRDSGLKVEMAPRRCAMDGRQVAQLGQGRQVMLGGPCMSGQSVLGPLDEDDDEIVEFLGSCDRCHD
jgi:hypothetical protein